MAIESIGSKSQILEAYEKYIILDEAQKKLLGKDADKYEQALKTVDPKVLAVISQIIDLGKCAPPDYPLVYGVQNYLNMQNLIDSYESLTKSQKKLIPSKYKKIYNTASTYFTNQVNNLKKLKKSIEKTQSPTREDIINWVEIYKQLDIASKWSFKHDSKFGGEEFYQKLEINAASYDLSID